ncbi:TPA: hypothetical protein ACGTP8_000421 [Yersinia enterocolitica]|uniref:hypothetical protein n=1 Tax=Yersinia massiliensis TaxID=419257 RepID=UPI000A5827B0|nr:hypothetical protein [Yersinia massiliensis]HEI6963762.1 hypothetical protein [Yersinia enterocolitica]
MSLLLVKACPQRGTLQGHQCTPTALLFEDLRTSLVRMLGFISNGGALEAMKHWGQSFHDKSLPECSLMSLSEVLPYKTRTNTIINKKRAITRLRHFYLRKSIAVMMLNPLCEAWV